LEIYRGLSRNGTDRIGPIDSPATIYFYLLSSSAAWGVDFAGANGSVGFSAGVTTSHLRVDILSTTLIEKNFSVQLLRPSGDAVLADPATATVLVFTSPGVIGWMPTNRTSPIDTGTPRSLRLLRTVGVYGAVTVRWSLRVDGSAGGVVGVSPTSGVEVFADGVDSVDVLLSPVPDGRPRPVQVCLAVLASSTGGANLPDAFDPHLLREKIVVVADSGQAYGIFQLSAQNSSIVAVCTTVSSSHMEYLCIKLPRLSLCVLFVSVCLPDFSKTSGPISIKLVIVYCSGKRKRIKNSGKFLPLMCKNSDNGAKLPTSRRSSRASYAGVHNGLYPLTERIRFRYHLDKSH